MGYVSTRMKKEINIESIVTIHYFEYMKNFVFQGESHDFWELLYVDKGEVSVRAENEWLTLHAGDIIFHRPNEFHAFESIGEKAPNLVAISFYCFSPAMHLFQKLHTTLTLEERTIISQIIAEARLAFSTPLHEPRIEQVHISEEAPFGAQQLITLYLELFLITIQRNRSSSGQLEHSPEPPLMESPANITAKQNQFQQISTYMEEQYLRPPDSSTDLLPILDQPFCLTGTVPQRKKLRCDRIFQSDED